MSHKPSIKVSARLSFSQSSTGGGSAPKLTYEALGRSQVLPHWLLASDTSSFHQGSVEMLTIWQLASLRVSEQANIRFREGEGVPNMEAT